MKKVYHQKAYNRLVLSGKDIIQGPVVVEYDEKERFLGWHHLVLEEERTEWIGGTCELNKP